MKNVNVQKIENLKDVQGKLEKVNFSENVIQQAYTQKRYEEVFELFSKISNNLEDTIPFTLNLNFIVLESFVRTINEYGHDGATKLFIENIKPRNFFYLINDLSIQNKYHSANKINDIFLSDVSTLKKLDSFYDEFNDLYVYCVKKGYSTLYIFSKLQNENQNDNYYFENLYNSIHQTKNIAKRHLACNVINELYNETNRSNLTERRINDYYYKAKALNDNWDSIISKIEQNLYNIDELYYLIETN